MKRFVLLFLGSLATASLFINLFIACPARSKNISMPGKQYGAWSTRLTGPGTATYPGIETYRACVISDMGKSVATFCIVLHVARLKKGLSTTHPLRADELRVIKAWLAERASMKPPCRTFFVSQKRQPLNRRTAWLTIRKYGDLAGLELPAHPHQLRHACGFALADQGADTRLIQDYLGHRDIRHTVIYTASNPARFERLWR